MKNDKQHLFNKKKEKKMYILLEGEQQKIVCDVN